MNVLSINKLFLQKGGSESVFFAETDLLEQNSHIKEIDDAGLEVIETYAAPPIISEAVTFSMKVKCD